MMTSEEFLSPGEGLSLTIAVLSLVVSILTALFTHRDRWSQLTVKLVGGQYFSPDRRMIRARVLAFNPSSRSNCIVKIQLWVSDGTRRTILDSTPGRNIAEDGSESLINTMPINVSSGQGTNFEVIGLEYKAFTLSHNCTFAIEATDVYGRTYTARQQFRNKWPRELFPNDVN